MITINRREAIDNMLRGIFGNINVNFESQKVIINDDRIRKTLFSPTSKTNLRHLLEVTFKNTDVVFEDKKKGKNFAIDKEMIIDNTVKYFRELGIYIPEIMNSTERWLLGIRMCDVLLEYMLPAIFRNINTEMEKIDIENVNISSEFNEAVDYIKSKFNSGDFFEQLYVDIKSSDIEKIYDTDYDKDECNYGLCVCTFFKIIFDVLKTVPSIYYYCDTKSEPSDFSNKCDGIFEKLTSRLEFKEGLDNKNFVSPYYFTEKQENRINKTKNKIKEYKLNFNVNIPTPSFIPRYYFFMTKLNDDIIKERYITNEKEEDTTSKLANEIYSALLEKAAVQIRTKYTNEIIQYYLKMLNNIEDVFSNFLAIDIESILSYKIESISDFKKALSSSCNEDDIDKMWDFCEEKGLSAQQTSRFIYCSIEDAMRAYSFLISDYVEGIENKPKILLVIEKYISKAVIEKHICTLTELLKNARIDELSKIRTKNNNFYWNNNAGWNIYYRIDSDAWQFPNPNRFKIIPEGCQSEEDDIKDVYRCLKVIIELYCDILRYNLNSDSNIKST